MVKQLKKTILVETISEEDKNSEYENKKEVLYSETVQVTRGIPKANKTRQHTVPETCTIVRTATNKATPTDTNKNLDKRRNNKEATNEQNFDTRLLINSSTKVTKKAFLKIIREYNTYSDRPPNAVYTYISNTVTFPYKASKAYQTAVRATKMIPKFSITGTDLTPSYTPADCLASTDRPDHNIKVVTTQSTTKRKTVNMKFQIKQINKKFQIKPLSRK